MESGESCQLAAMVIQVEPVAETKVIAYVI